VCGCDDNWQGVKMSLILDHINGDPSNHTKENLRFLCPNCDSIQSTYKGRNNNKEKVEIRKNEKLEYSKNIKIKQEKKIIDIRNKLMENINFEKYGWNKRISELMGNWSAQYSGVWIRRYCPDIWENAWKQK
jgi:hypothetical protein